MLGLYCTLVNSLWPYIQELNLVITVPQVNSLRPSDAYIGMGKLTIIGSDKGMSPGWRQAIICTNAGILLIGPLGTNLREILIAIVIPPPNEVGGGYTGFTLSVRPSVCLSVDDMVSGA